MRRGVLPALLLCAAAAGCWKSGPDPKLRLLDEILVSRNDNDPRLDREFQGLSAETKRRFRLRYRELAPERRNDRGTIVYLLGLNLSSAEDWDFLREVLSEPPCLSLADCSRPGAPSEAGDDVTLAYPALVALRQAERARAGAPAQADRVLEAAKLSPLPAVRRMVARLKPE